MALSSGWQPWVDAVGGAFIPTDIAQDVAAARLFNQRVDPYGPVIREMHGTVVSLPANETFPYFPHPPFSLIVSWGLAFGSYQTAALIWFSASVALLLVLSGLVVELWLPPAGSSVPLSSVLLVFGILLCWPPVLYNLEKGQWSILLAVLVALGGRALVQRQDSAGAVWLAAAASVKVFPVVLGGYLLLRSRRALAWFIASGLALTALPLLRIGFDAFPAFVRQSQMNMPFWETFPSVTFSLHGALARLLIGGPWAHPLVSAPIISKFIELIVVVPLLALATQATLRSTANGDTLLPFAAWVTMLPVLNPQSLGHNGVLLVLPIVIALRALQADRRTWLRALWALSVVLVSIPRQTTWRLAPPPIDPLEGLLVVALPMWGALMLFGVTIALARSASLSARSVEVKVARILD